MSISESNHEDETEEDSDENSNQDIPDEFIELYKDEELRKTLVSPLSESLLNCLNKKGYTGVPHLLVFTTADPTTAVFGFCKSKWGIFALVGDPLKLH